MRFLKDMLSESPNVSLLRCMSAGCCIMAFIIAIAVLFTEKPDFSGASMLCGVFLAAAFGGKIAQKSMDKPPLT